MNTLFFTVLIGKYNYGQYLEETILSVISQHFSVERQEILVVNER
jgi:glycosyltransferase involved in cell wall biosynthesis